MPIVSGGNIRYHIEDYLDDEYDDNYDDENYYYYANNYNDSHQNNE